MLCDTRLFLESFSIVSSGATFYLPARAKGKEPLRRNAGPACTETGSHTHFHTFCITLGT